MLVFMNVQLKKPVNQSLQAFYNIFIQNSNLYSCKTTTFVWLKNINYKYENNNNLRSPINN